MSNVNTDLVRGFYESAENLFKGLHEDIVWQETEGMPYGGTYEGKEAVMAGVFNHLETDWRDFNATPDGIHAVGEDQVLSTGYYKGVSKRTGRRLRAAFAHLYRIQDGKAVHFRQFGDSHSFREPML